MVIYNSHVSTCDNIFTKAIEKLNKTYIRTNIPGQFYCFVQGNKDLLTTVDLKPNPSWD